MFTLPNVKSLAVRSLVVVHIKPAHNKPVFPLSCVASLFCHQRDSGKSPAESLASFPGGLKANNASDFSFPHCVYSHHLDKWDVTIYSAVSHTSDTPRGTRHILSQVLLTSVGELASTICMKQIQCPNIFIFILFLFFVSLPGGNRRKTRDLASPRH